SAWKTRRDELDTGATKLSEHVEQALAAKSALALRPDRGLIAPIAEKINGLIDPIHGGIAGAPKFPNAPYMQALWLAAHDTGNRSFAESVILSLERMLSGGIYDHVGGGLCRYSTDEQWIVPHFEKMLYDNAQLLLLLNQVFPVAPTDLFRSRIESTIAFLERELKLESGAFAASLDADSDGEEGLYYLWDRAEIEKVLGADAGRFLEWFSLRAPEAWHGRPILVRNHTAPDL